MDTRESYTGWPKNTPRLDSPRSGCEERLPKCHSQGHDSQIIVYQLQNNSTTNSNSPLEDPGTRERSLTSYARLLNSVSRKLASPELKGVHTTLEASLLQTSIPVSD